MSDLINEFEEITRWPKKRLDKEYIIKYLSEKFQPGIEYSEKEINSIIKKHHTFNDIPLLRRELISKKYLFRKDDCSIYWKNQYYHDYEAVRKFDRKRKIWVGGYFIIIILLFLIIGLVINQYLQVI